ncbi:MAG: hypothetical protein IKK57_01795 [Clostridia bacterium]|nr:hypothetical protein [Clostridia bacterium]
MPNCSTGLPRWFRFLFVVIMLALCVVMVSQILRHQSLSAEIADLTGKLDTAQKRLLKQQREMEQYCAELPDVLAELELAEPAAEAAAARVTELKAQRSALRETVAAQEAVIAQLQSQLAALPVPADTSLQVDEVLTVLTEAQDALRQ